MLINVLIDLKIIVKIIDKRDQKVLYPPLNNLLFFYLHKINTF